MRLENAKRVLFDFMLPGDVIVSVYGACYNID